MQVLRFEPKTFRQRRPVEGGWENSVKDVRPVPYRLPQLLAAPMDAPIYIVEGEKDADRLAALGLVATCCAGGAGKWRAQHAQHFQGRAAILIPDNDSAGRDHMQKSEKLRTDKVLMAQVDNNTKDQAMRANLPTAAVQIIVGAMQSHQTMATKLLSDATTRGLFLDVVYDILKRDNGGDLMAAVR